MSEELIDILSTKIDAAFLMIRKIIFQCSTLHIFLFLVSKYN